uniref:EGF-like domain-containing protein n=1 Tax=Caenorhabditis tropicalis TaxID=1561998 RepID=A0A1I7TFK8_9PELO
MINSFFVYSLIPFTLLVAIETENATSAEFLLPTRRTPPSKPQHGIDFLGPLWLSRTYKITCCRRGNPIAENPQLVSNWTQTASDYAVDEKLIGTEQDDHCRVFQGTFLLSAAALYNSTFISYGVQCKCPDAEEQQLDQHCRRLPACQNGGYRSQSMGRRCSCPQPYFGEYCEKLCDQGQVLVGIDGHNYCSCLPFYQGETCSDLVCLNGGHEFRGRCSCPHNFVGYHCEIDTNKTKSNSRYTKYGPQSNAENGELFSRDISGTVFSLVMIVVLVVSMYLLMKHRMQVQSQYTTSRREEMNRAAQIYGIERGGGGTTTISRDDIRILPFVAAGIQPPPPYAVTRTTRRETLPPLPSYEDATKDTVIGQAATVIEMQPTSTTDEASPPQSTPPVESNQSNDSRGPDIPSSSSPPPPFESEAPTIQRNVSTRRSL